jgi:uncharacterized membrane protein HdeD (DUF308 family)
MKAESINIERSVHVLVVDVATLARNWWVVLLRGIAGILFGLATFFAPGISPSCFSSAHSLLSMAFSPL